MDIVSVGDWLKIDGVVYDNILGHIVSNDNDFIIIVSSNKDRDLLSIQHVVSTGIRKHATSSRMTITYPTGSYIDMVELELLKYESECEIVFHVNGREKYITIDTGSVLHS